MATATDNFTDTDGTNLTAHTADTGETYTNHPSYAGNNTINTNKLRCDTGGNGTLAICSFSPASADYSAQINCTDTPSGSVSVVIGCRWSSLVQTGYVSYWAGSNSRWELRSYVVGVNSLLGSYSGDSPETTTVKTQKQTWSGTAGTLDIDSVNRISITDVAIASAGKAVVGGGDSGSVKGDTFNVTDAAGAALAIPVVMYQFRQRHM